MRESDLGRLIQVALTQEGARAFRNENGAYETPSGQWVTYGLGEGSSDLIGWTHDGRFLAIEVKTPGGRTTKKRLEKQRNYIEQVNKAGGVGFFAESVEEAVRKYREGVA